MGESTPCWNHQRRADLVVAAFSSSPCSFFPRSRAPCSNSSPIFTSLIDMTSREKNVGHLAVPSLANV